MFISVNLRPKGVNHEQLFVKIKGQEAYDMYGPYVRELLEESGLKQTANGTERSAYCFRLATAMTGCSVDASAAINLAK
jgi:hypothetical protein